MRRLRQRLRQQQGGNRDSGRQAEGTVLGAHACKSFRMGCSGRDCIQRQDGEMTTAPGGDGVAANCPIVRRRRKKDSASLEEKMQQADPFQPDRTHIRAAASLLLLFTTRALAQPAQITLPEIPALELPAGKTQLAPTDPPLRDLLAAATSGKLRITNDLDHPIGQGATRITWTAWEGQKNLATKAATIFVLPTGMTPSVSPATKTPPPPTTPPISPATQTATSTWSGSTAAARERAAAPSTAAPPSRPTVPSP